MHNKDGEGQKRLAKREFRYWGVTIIGCILALLVLEAMRYFSIANPEYIAGGDSPRWFIHPFAAIAGSIFLALFFIVFNIYTFKIIDEQEKVAFHWANTVSWNCLCIISFVWFLLNRAQLVAPVDGYITLGISAGAGLVVWAWKKYF